MSKNSQKSNYSTMTDWLKDINPTSESLHQPKVVVEKKTYQKRK